MDSQSQQLDECEWSSSHWLPLSEAKRRIPCRVSLTLKRPAFMYANMH